MFLFLKPSSIKRVQMLIVSRDKIKGMKPFETISIFNESALHR